MTEENKVEGAEGIVIHNGKIVLGMQKKSRWYNLENGEQASIIKTLGGQIEPQDQNCSKNALIREILEEVKGVNPSDVRISKRPVFTKTMQMMDLNPYETEAKLIMNADFYVVQLSTCKNIYPNDLPALVELPLETFMKLKFCRSQSTENVLHYIIKNKNFTGNLPENYALMVPEEVKLFFEKIIGDFER